MESDDRLHDVHAAGDGRRDSSPPPSAAVAAAQVLIAETLRETLVEEHRERGTTKAREVATAARARLAQVERRVAGEP